MSNNYFNTVVVSSSSGRSIMTCLTTETDFSARILECRKTYSSASSFCNSHKINHNSIRLSIVEAACEAPYTSTKRVKGIGTILNKSKDYPLSK